MGWRRTGSNDKGSEVNQQEAAFPDAGKGIDAGWKGEGSGESWETSQKEIQEKKPSLGQHRNRSCLRKQINSSQAQLEEKGGRTCFQKAQIQENEGKLASR